MYDGLGAGLQNSICLLPEDFGKERMLCIRPVGDSPCAGIGAGGEQTPKSGEFLDIICGVFKNGSDCGFAEPTGAPQIGDGGKGGHPNSPVFGHGGECVSVGVCPMLDGVHSGRGGGLHGVRAVAVRHDGEALLVGDVDQLLDLGGRKTFLGQYSCPVKIHQAGNHNFDKICAVFLSTTQKKDDNGYMFNYIYPDMSDNNMVGYIEQVKQRMLYETGVSLEPTDKIITLSTCIYDYGKSVDTRLVVVGRLLHEGESEQIDASLVKDNPDYRRPQVWYNSKGKTNPYKNSAKWEPSPN